jgi:hypothetical protein
MRETCRKLPIFRIRNPLWAAVAIALGLMLSTNAKAATITVDSLADTGAPGICVLRDAITAANTRTTTNGCGAGTGKDMINFDVTGTISIGSTLPEITDSNLTIYGPPLPGIEIESSYYVNAMEVASNATVSVDHLTIAGATGPNAVPISGILNYGTLTVTNTTLSYNNQGIGNAGGSLTVINSTFSSSFPGSGIGTDSPATVINSTFVDNGQATLKGGGIANYGPLTVINSTFVGNSALFGGGIYNGSGTVTITNSTFSHNVALSGGGGIYNGGTTMTIKGSILAASSQGGGDCSGIITDAGYNISDDSSCGFSATGSLNNTDPMLDPAGLVNNGGPTRTIALLSGSPAIDAIPVADCTDQDSPPDPIITDQRLFPRPDNEEDLCDIGAYEFADTPFIPFSRFRGSLKIDSDARVLQLSGRFNLGTGGSIDPTTQPVAFSVGKNALRLPVGSFVQNDSGYVYQKRFGHSFLRASIEFTNTLGSYRLLVYQKGGPLFTTPVLVTLIIGNNSGSTLMNARSN